MAYLGRHEIDDLLTFPANTHVAATGAATDADSVPSYRVYEDETGTPILTGSMALLDSSNTAGFYSEQITLSAANGFEVGKSYTIYISATVSSVVGTMSYTFQVEAALATSAQATAIEADTQDIQSRIPTALTSGRINANVGALEANVITATSINADAITDAKVAADVTIASVTGAVGSVTGNVGGNVAGSVASVTAGVTLAANAVSAAAVAADAVTEIQSGLATAANLATLQTSVDDLPTNAELATSQAAADDATLAAIAALNNLSAAQVNAEVDTAITDAALATAAALTTVDTVVDAIKVVTDALTSAAAAKLALSAGTIVTGAAIAGTLSTTAMTTNLTEATDDHLNGRIVIFTSGALQYQASDIVDYDGGTKMITVTALTEAPQAGDTFVIV